MLPNDFRSLGKAAAAQSVFCSNLYFWSTVNYFAAEVTSAPLLHTWSLAVEEQFYVFFPLFLLGAYRFMPLRRRGVMLGVLALGFFLSFGCSAYGMQKSPFATFYLLPTRAWELLSGSLLAVFPVGWTPVRRGVREAISGLGLLAILWVMFSYDSETRFPGLAALPPCLGAAMIIWSNGIVQNSGGGGTALTTVGRVLASPVPVSIGLISYSLYLWHWPLLAFSNYLAREPFSLLARVGIVVLSLVLATLSWWLVETPFRKRQVFASQKSVLAFASVGLVSMFVTGAVISRGEGFPGRFPTRVKDLANADADHLPHPELTAQDVLTDHLMSFGADLPGAKPQILVWGDSHAAVSVPAFDLYGKRYGITGRAAVHGSTTPLLDYYTYSTTGLNERSVAFSRAVLEYVKKNRIPRVFLIAYWSRDLAADPEGLERAFARTIKAFEETDATLYVLQQIPSQPIDVPRALALDALRPGGAVDWRRSVQAHRLEQAAFYRMASKNWSARCVFVDPAPAILDPDGLHYQVVRDGSPLYTDRHHLSLSGATTVLEPFLEKVLEVR